MMCARTVVMGFLLAFTALSPLPLFAAERCGDDVCGMLEKKEGTCSGDCRRFRGWCGNSFCELNENCRTCSADCGRCIVEGEDEGEILEQCGDLVCNALENCSDCPGDCGICPKSWSGAMQYQLRRALRLARLYLQRGVSFAGGSLKDAVAFVEEKRHMMEATALERTEAAQELLMFLQEHDRIDRHFSGIDQQLVMLVGGGEGTLNILNKVPSIRVTHVLQGAMKMERRTLSTLTEEWAGDLGVKELLGEERTENLLNALQKEEMNTVAKELPSPHRAFPVLTQELRNLEELFLPEAKEENTQGFLPRALAKDAPKEEGAVKAFEKSVHLLQDMRRKAQDPTHDASNLEENIAYLQDRHNLLSGVIRMREDDVTDALSTLEQGEASPSHLLDVAGMMRFVGQSENFQEFARMYHRAIERLWSPFSFFSRRPSLPEALEEESLALLPEGANDPFLLALEQSHDMAGKREALLSFLHPQAVKATELLSLLPESEQRSYEERIAAWTEKLRAAESVMDLHASLSSFQSIVEEIEGSARNQKNVFLRMVYVLQDFLGIA